MSLLVDHVIFSHLDFWWDLGVGIFEIFRYGFSRWLILKFDEYVLGHLLKILLDNVSSLNILIDIEMPVPVILDNMKLDDHFIWGWATVLEADKISIRFYVSHLSLRWHVDEGVVGRKVLEDFGTVTDEVLEGDGLVVKVGLGVVGEFEDHLGCGAREKILERELILL